MIEDPTDECEHEKIKNGKCVDCGYECEHPDTENNHCLVCGEATEPSDPRAEPEWRGDR